MTLVVVVAPGATGATGAVKGVVAVSEAVTVGTWGASASPATLTFSSSQSLISTVTNTGNMALSQIGYTITITVPSKGTPTYTLFACPVAWVAGLCLGGGGTQVGGTLTTPSTTNVTSTVVPAVGGSVYLEAMAASFHAGGGTANFTIAPAVTAPVQLRSPLVTNQ